MGAGDAGAIGMANPDSDLQSWFDEMPDDVQRKMSPRLKTAADELAGAIKDAAPRKKGDLAESVQVRETDDGFEVTAGGDLTTKQIRDGSGVEYDYAMAIEFGTQDIDAEPFFFATARRVNPKLQDDIEDGINEALS
jgi:hypothetical protein